MTAVAIEAVAASAVLMLLVLVVRVPVRRVFGAQLAYALWAIPFLRLLLPPLPAEWRAGAVAPIARIGRQASALVLPARHALPDALAAPGVPIGAIVVLAWIAGAAAFLLWQVLGYARFRRRVLRGAVAVDRLRSIAIIESAAVDGPLAFGVMRRVVAFPRDFAARFDADERDLALAHELGHHARGDLIANWVALAMLALHWFDPIAWIAFRAFRADQEMANDAGVLARRGDAARHAYGRAIVKAARGGALTPACHLNTVEDLKGRLRMLGTKGVSRPRIAIGVVATATLALGALGVTASGTQAAQRMRATVAERTGVDLSALHPAAALGVPADAGTRGGTMRVVVARDGVTRRYDGAAAEAYIATHAVPVPPVPPMSPVPPVAHVPDAWPVPPVPPMPPVPPVADAADADRSARDAERWGRAAEVRAMRSARAEALHSAIAGLEQSRAGLLANTHLTAAHRAEALSGIDAAIGEMRDAIASRD